MLGDDFAVTPGPDYRVLLVPKPAIRAAADVANTMYVDLGPLAAFQGSQSFAVPAGVDLVPLSERGHLVRAPMAR